MSQLYKENIVKSARKNHRCSHCFTNIPKGSRYHTCSGLYDGEFFSAKAHLECHEKYIEFNHEAYNGNDDWWPLDEWEGFTDFKKKQLAIYGEYKC